MHDAVARVGGCLQVGYVDLVAGSRYDMLVTEGDDVRRLAPVLGFYLVQRYCWPNPAAVDQSDVQSEPFATVA